MKKILVILVLLIISINVNAQTLQDWGRKQAITINNTYVTGSSDLTDFPFLVTLDHLDSEIVDGGTNSALNGGGDIRFSSDAAGNNRLACEIVSLVTDATAANRQCQVWVKIPSLPSTSDTTIYIWYNKSGETQPVATDAYGSQAVWTNYSFVSHDCLTDSSGNKTINQTVAASTGASVFDGTTADFDGVDDRHTIDILDWDLTTGQTITFWANYNNTGVYKRLINLINSTGVIQFIKGDIATSPEDIIFFSSTDLLNDGESGESIKADHTVQDQWFYIKGSTVDLDTGRNFKSNNIDYSSTLPAIYNWTPSTNENLMTIGARGDNSNHYQGRIASLMVSPFQLSDGYIASAYNNQSSPSTFATPETPVSVSADTESPTPPTLSSTDQTDTTVDLSWLGATDNIGVTGYNIYIDGVLETTLGNVSSYQ
ncbi:DUF2341 domain-containing protein, partial [Flavivirga aquimarina]